MEAGSHLLTPPSTSSSHNLQAPPFTSSLLFTPPCTSLNTSSHHLFAPPQASSHVLTPPPHSSPHLLHTTSSQCLLKPPCTNFTHLTSSHLLTPPHTTSSHLPASPLTCPHLLMPPHTTSSHLYTSLHFLAPPHTSSHLLALLCTSSSDHQLAPPHSYLCLLAPPYIISSHHLLAPTHTSSHVLAPPPGTPVNIMWNLGRLPLTTSFHLLLLLLQSINEQVVL